MIKPNTNSLFSVYPKIAQQWHPTKNGKLTPQDVTYGSGRRTWWLCSRGHEWTATVNTRTSHADSIGCPYCAGQKICIDNCLATLDHKLASEWHPSKNGTLTPKDIMPYSSKNAWWLCAKGHSYSAKMSNRSRGDNCPYCSGHKVCIDNCLATINPDVAKEWDYTNNGKLTPYDFTHSSHQLIRWVCDKRHEWSVTIHSRTVKGSGCPYCSHRYVTTKTCLAFLNPKLALEWHPTKNEKLFPKDVTNSSAKKVYWQCNSGHIWMDTVCHRTSGRGCPYCSGKRVCIDNCLATKLPSIAKEWHPTKNHKSTAYDFTTGSHKAIWWMCINGHSYNATIHDRSDGNGCPYCDGILLRGNILCDSIPEAYLYLKYRIEGVRFKHNKKYDRRFGQHRYDFYLIDENKYVEVTSYTKKSNRGKWKYIGYLRNIVNKKRFVENVLGAKFEFIQFTPSREQIAIVRAAEKVR